MNRTTPHSAFILTLVAPTSEALYALDRTLTNLGLSTLPLSGRDLERRVGGATPAELHEARDRVLAVLPMCRAEPIMVACRSRPLRMSEGEHTIGGMGNATSDFAVVRLRVMRAEGGRGNHFETEFAGPAEIEALNAAVARGVARVMDCGIGESGPLIETKVVFIDGAFHPQRSTSAAFEAAAEAALVAACGRAGLERLEPALELDIEVPRDDVLARLKQFARYGVREMRRTPGRNGVRIRVELPASALLLEEARAALLAQAVGTVEFGRWRPAARS